MLSILIPTNNTKYIRELFNSINTQTWDGEFEVIVAVDGCEWCLYELLDMYEEFEWLNIYYCSKNMGTYKTINTLLELSDGNDKYIFGSDDIMHPDLLKTLYEVEADFKQTQYWNLHGDKITLEKSGHHAAGSVWMNQKCIDVLGGYKPWKYSADTEFVERVKSSFLKHVQIDKPAFIYRHHSDNLTYSVNQDARVKQRSEIKWNGYEKHELKVSYQIGRAHV